MVGDKAVCACSLVLFLDTRANGKSRAGGDKAKFPSTLGLLSTCMWGSVHSQPAVNGIIALNGVFLWRSLLKELMLYPVSNLLIRFQASLTSSQPSCIS